ncbi:hypothetical protein FB480_101136 [Agrobacterium vitis]|nr:hypothetical protein FB480_101136 [Agrobacterium vitis]
MLAWISHFSAICGSAAEKMMTRERHHKNVRIGSLPRHYDAFMPVLAKNTCHCGVSVV